MTIEYFESEDYGTHWGHIPIRRIPRHEPEVLDAMYRKRLEKLNFPIFTTTLDLKI